MQKGTLLLLPLLLALACGVEKEQRAAFQPLEEVSFDVLDKVNDDFEGVPDTVRIEATEGELTSAELFTSGNGFSYVHQMEETSEGSGIFEVTVNFDAYPVNWYINASGNGVSASHGSFNDPKVAQKYLIKDNADQMLLSTFKEGLSSRAVFRDYEPNSLGNTFTYPPEDSELSGNVTAEAEFDHYVFTFSSEDFHQAYGIEYSTEVNDVDGDKIPVTDLDLSTSTSDALESMPQHNIGYIIISSTTRDGMTTLLNDNDFFPETFQRAFIEVIRK
jgi:hypothetical protein